MDINNIDYPYYTSVYVPYLDATLYPKVSFENTYTASYTYYNSSSYYNAYFITDEPE
jgi:hypothetical protein